jgi:hypothetical protein
MVLLLSPAKFNALLSNDRPGLGQNVTVQRATQCPCRSPTSGAAEQGCPLCRGKSYIYDAAITAWTGLAGQKVMRQWAQFGMFEEGDVICTIPSNSPMYAIGENDKVVFTDSTEPFSQIVMGGVDYLPWPVVQIDRVIWRAAVTKALVEGGIPVQETDGTLTWASGAPPTGTQYSVTGRRNPAYWVFQEFPQDRAHSAGLALPRRVVLRKYSLAGH